MSTKINEKYIQEFFGLEDTPSGKKELAEIKGKLKKQVYENGQDIIKIDDEPDGMYFLESGTANVLDRDLKQINIMHEGQYFGEYGVLSKEKRLSTVRSLGKTVCYKIEAGDMMEFISKYPDIYGRMMKKVYGEVSKKHSQILALSGMKRGILRHPSNDVPMSKTRMLLQYGGLLLVYALSYILIPRDTTFPVFVLPLALMLGYVMFTKRTIESLIVSIVYAALLVYRTDVSAGFTDAMMDTMGQKDNVFTVLVMVLMGGIINLIAASGAVTAFKKLEDKKAGSKKRTMFSALGIMAVTSIDDGLNMLCASTSVHSAGKKNGIISGCLGLLFSMTPTVLSSFIPLSLWGIFVIGTLTASVKGNAVTEFAKSIPFNFFSIVVVISMFLVCMDKFPKIKELKDAEKRAKDKGVLYPAGSEKYLNVSEPEMWGKIYNIIIPIVVLAAASLIVRSVIAGSFVVDSACGLVIALIVMFIMYCAQGLMTPEQFTEHLIDGIAGSALPVILYLLTMCFSTLLDTLSLGEYFGEAVNSLEGLGPVLPAIFFVASVLLTIALGSSWAMYAIAFPVVLHLAYSAGLSVPLCIGAVSGAGIAGEKICAFTADALNVGTAIGCNPEPICRIRIFYSIVISGIVTGLYIIAGFIM
jgi:CRP-like cAMP-binding protein